MLATAGLEYSHLHFQNKITDFLVSSVFSLQTAVKEIYYKIILITSRGNALL